MKEVQSVEGEVSSMRHPSPLMVHTYWSEVMQASVSNRKGKTITAFEIKMKCKWQGEYDYDEVTAGREGMLGCTHVIGSGLGSPAFAGGGGD